MAVNNSDQDNLALLYGGMDPASSAALANLGMPTGTGGWADPTTGAGVPTVAPAGVASTMPVAPGATGPGPSSMPPNGVMPAGARRSNVMDQVKLPTPPTPPTMTPIPQMDAGLKAKLVAAQTPTDRSQYKPHWWDRLLAFGLGTAAGYGDPERGERTAANFANRRYIGAEQGRLRSLAPLQEQQHQYEESLGPIEKGNEEATKFFDVQSKNYDNLVRQMQLNQERGEIQAGAVPRIDRTDPDNPKYMYRTRSGEEFEGPEPPGTENAARRNTEDQNTPATGARPERYIDPETKKPGLRVKTKAGGYMPYAPKSIDEGAMEGDPTAQRLYNQAHPGDKTGKVSKAQQARLYDTRDSGWEKAKRDYDKAVGMLGPKDKEGLKAAQEDYYEARQQAQNTFEDKIETMGGTADHVVLPRNHFGEEGAVKPAAGAGAKAAAATGHKAGDVVKLKGVGSVRITKMHADGKTFDYEKAGK